MKVLLFTHKNDIDGIGCAILGKLAFTDLYIEFSETFEINQKFNNKISYFNEYDKIFVTDLCLNEELLKIIDESVDLKYKIQILDHHKTYDSEEYTKYPFVKVQIKNDNGLCCGTSMFYNYLVSNKYLYKSLILDEFVELTRQHDTWEWKNIYKNDKSRELALLFDSLKINGYIDFILKKLKNDEMFEFNSFEQMLINNKKLEIAEVINEYLNQIYYRDILGLKAGIVFINYEYRNELADYLKENQCDIDLVMMIALDRNVVVYRRIDQNISVRKVAEYFGGKGHDAAASNPLSIDTKENIIELLLSK